MLQNIIFFLTFINQKVQKYSLHKIYIKQHNCFQHDNRELSSKLAY